LRRIVRKVTNDPDTGAPVIDYQPFSVSETDLPLMTGLREAWFEYLDLHPEKATDQAENGAGPAEKSTGPVWRLEWKSRKDVPYPDAIRSAGNGETRQRKKFSRCGPSSGSQRQPGSE